MTMEMRSTIHTLCKESGLSVVMEAEAQPREEVHAHGMAVWPNGYMTQSGRKWEELASTCPYRIE